MTYKLKYLTKKQEEVLDVILSYIKTNGYSPSIREIKNRSKLKSLRGIVLQLEALKQAGLIKRNSIARGIAVLPSLLEENPETISVPLMACSIHAGKASEADDFSDEKIKVSLIQTRGLKNVFAVRVCGDSMINEGINDGDIGIVFPQPVANDGEIVAAKTADGITLKKYRIVEGRPILFPANPEHPPITQDFKIQGKLINIIKR